MCNHCRLMIGGAFVIGALVGAATSGLIIDKKNRRYYEEEVEASRDAAKRVIRKLRSQLGESGPERDEPQEKGQEAFEGYLRAVEREYSPSDEEENEILIELKRESEKIPEGNFEGQIRFPTKWYDTTRDICLISEETFDNAPEDKEQAFLHFWRADLAWTYEPAGTLLASDVMPKEEAFVADCIGGDILHRFYEIEEKTDGSMFFVSNARTERQYCVRYHEGHYMP